MEQLVSTTLSKTAFNTEEFMRYNGSMDEKSLMECYDAMNDLLLTFNTAKVSNYMIMCPMSETNFTR